MKHAKNIEEAWEEKLRNEKEKMLMEFLNKKFRDHIARHKKKNTIIQMQQKVRTGVIKLTLNLVVRTILCIRT